METFALLRLLENLFSAPPPPAKAEADEIQPRASEQAEEGVVEEKPSTAQDTAIAFLAAHDTRAQRLRR